MSSKLIEILSVVDMYTYKLTLKSGHLFYMFAVHIWWSNCSKYKLAIFSHSAVNTQCTYTQWVPTRKMSKKETAIL